MRRTRSRSFGDVFCFGIAGERFICFTWYFHTGIDAISLVMVPLFNNRSPLPPKAAYDPEASGQGGQSAASKSLRIISISQEIVKEKIG